MCCIPLFNCVYLLIDDIKTIQFSSLSCILCKSTSFQCSYAATKKMLAEKQRPKVVDAILQTRKGTRKVRFFVMTKWEHNVRKCYCHPDISKPIISI